MTADVELLPCPFCGGQVFIHHGHRDIGYVTCGQRDDGSDGCGVVASFRPNKGGREAIAAWNRRATAAKDAEIADLMERNRSLMDALNVAELSNEALRAEVKEARRIAIEHADARAFADDRANMAEARAERLAEALVAERDRWAARKADAIREQAGGMTRGDPEAVARCDAAIQRIDAAIDQARGKGEG